MLNEEGADPKPTSEHELELANTRFSEEERSSPDGRCDEAERGRHISQVEGRVII